MELIVAVGGTGSGRILDAYRRMYEQEKRNVEAFIIRMEEERENFVRALTKSLFDAFDFAEEVHSAFVLLEDDETKARRIEKEFFADIQKLYGYHACMEKIIHQLQNPEAGESRILNNIIRTESVKLDVVCNQAQSLEYPMPAKNESRFRFIRNKKTCSKGEVRLKPPLRCIWELLLQTLERTLKISEEKMQKQWEKWQYPQKRVRKIWTELYQESRQKLQRYRNNKTHPEAILKFQYRSRDFIFA